MTQTPLSLRARWRLYMILGMNLLVLVIAGTATLITVIEQRQAVLRLQRSAASQMGAAVLAAAHDVQAALAYAAQLPDADSDALLGAYPALHTITRESPPANADQEPLWQAIRAGEPYTGLTESDPPQALLAVPASAGGALVALADPRLLWQDAISTRFGTRGRGYLVSPEGTVLAAGPGVTVQDPQRPATLDVFRDGGTGLDLYKGVDDRWVVGRAAPLPGTGFVLLTETPLSEFTPALVRVGALWAMALLLTVAIGEWLIRRILRTVVTPFDILSQGAHAVGGGDYGYRVRLPASTDRELVELGNAFNAMIDRLQKSQKQIDAYTHEMEETVDLRARELSRKAMQLEVAANVSRKIATILDPRALIDEVVGLIRDRFSVYHVEILLVDSDQGTITPGVGNHTPSLQPLSIRSDATSVIAWVARHAQTLYVPDVLNEPRYRFSNELPASRCELAIPLTFRERVIGVLNLEADHRDAFPKDEIAVLESLANEIAVSIHNAQIFDALETANRDLAQATLEARQAHTLKSRFLLNASHKLRTPLNAIIGYSETILTGVYGDVSEKVQDRQRRILDNGRVLQALIEDMLDLSSIETGYMELQLGWVDLPALMDEVMNASHALHQTGFPDHTLDLRLDLPEDLPPVWADVDRLRYILINLMSNAVKFTPDGEVVMSADADGQMVHVHVRDSGPGIQQDVLAVLFEPFQHKHGSTASSGKGTGLGLPVSRLLALRHGGDLTVDSALNKGSTFTLSLPLRGTP